MKTEKEQIAEYKEIKRISNIVKKRQSIKQIEKRFKELVIAGNIKVKNFFTDEEYEIILSFWEKEIF